MVPAARVGSRRERSARLALGAGLVDRRCQPCHGEQRERPTRPREEIHFFVGRDELKSPLKTLPSGGRARSLRRPAATGSSRRVAIKYL